MHDLRLGTIAASLWCVLLARAVAKEISTRCKLLLGPFYGAIAVPSVTRCRCCCCRRRCCCGHRCAGGVRQWRRETVATPGERPMRRAAARSGEWAQHFSNASYSAIQTKYVYRHRCFTRKFGEIVRDVNASLYYDIVNEIWGQRCIRMRRFLT